jgi:hypothetical protein
MSMQAWDVYLNGRLIDTVFANGYDAEEMRRSLIDHDGYDYRIEVCKPKVTCPAMVPAKLTRKARGQ